MVHQGRVAGIRRRACAAMGVGLLGSTLLVGCSTADDSGPTPSVTATSGGASAAASASSTQLPRDGLRADGPTRVTIGTAVNAEGFSEASYRRVLVQNFSSVTPENQMKWVAIEPTRGQVDYSAADALVRFARANGQIVRGHTLLWSGGLPTWVASAITSCDSAKSLLQQHIADEVGHFKGQVAQWDVANEVLDAHGQPRQDNPFIKACGIGIVADAFRWAHEADPAASLYLNDYDTLTGGEKAGAQYSLVKTLHDQGVPIDGVGFQAHLTLSGVPSDAAVQLQRYASLGLDVALTETDVRIRATDAPSIAQMRDQATIYQQLVDLCLDQPRCTNFTVWGFGDKWSWVPASNPGMGWACLFDDALDPKPAYTAVRQALVAHL